MKIILFIATFVGTFFSSMMFASIIPGGDEGNKMLIGAIATLVSVVVVCTSIIVGKLNELKK